MLLKGGRTVSGNFDIRIEDGKIARVAPNIEPFAGEEVMNIEGKLVFPGLIDCHTHFKLKSRGTVTADDFYSGSISAAFGGVTTFIDYADQEPDSLVEGVERRIEEAEGEAAIDYSLHLSINDNFLPEKHLDELEKVRERGISSLKIFTTYRGMYMLADEKLRSLFEGAKKAGLLITVHAEKDEIIAQNEEKYKKLSKLGVEYHPDIRPGISEGEAVKDLCQLAEEYDFPVYIVHLSSKEGLEQVREFAKRGVRVLAETTPHYLVLTRDKLNGEKGRLSLMTPPLREKEDSRALWEGLKEGLIKVIATDHCAFSVKQKEEGMNSLDIFPGIPGVETMLPLIYTKGVLENIISLKDMIELLSKNPAKIFGLYPEKGSLEEGTDADLVIFDPNIEWTLSGNVLHSRAGYTPFEGIRVRGKVQKTILRGEVIVDGDTFKGKKGTGRFVRAEKSLFL